MAGVGHERQALGASQSAIERPSHIWVPPCAAVLDRSWGVARSSVSRRAPPRGGRQAGLEPGAVGLALDDEVVGAAGEAIEGLLTPRDVNAALEAAFNRQAAGRTAVSRRTVLQSADDGLLLLMPAASLPA